MAHLYEGYLDHHYTMIAACQVKNKYKDPWCFQISALHVSRATVAKFTRQQHIHGGGLLDDLTWELVNTSERVEFSSQQPVLSCKLVFQVEKMTCEFTLSFVHVHYSRQQF